MPPRSSADVRKACALVLVLAIVPAFGEEAAKEVKPEAAAEATAENPVKERLDGGEYERRVARFEVDRITPEEVEASKLPDFGVVVNDAAAEGPGAKAGLLKGWVIDRYNGKDYWNHHQGMQAQADNNDARREIEAVSPEGERKTFHFGPGRPRAVSIEEHRPRRLGSRHADLGAGLACR